MAYTPSLFSSALFISVYICPRVNIIIKSQKPDIIDFLPYIWYTIFTDFLINV